MNKERLSAEEVERLLDIMCGTQHLPQQSEIDTFSQKAEQGYDVANTAKRIGKPVETLVMELEGKTIELIVFESDIGETIVKIITDDSSVGVGAEYAFINHQFPGYKFVKQELASITINGRSTLCDILTIHNETETKRVCFDITGFYPERRSMIGKTVILWLLGIFFLLLLLCLFGGLVKVLLGLESLF